MSDAKKPKVVSYEITGGPGNNTHYKGTLPERSSTKLGRNYRPFNPASAPCLSEDQGELIFNGKDTIYVNHSISGSVVKYAHGGEEVLKSNLKSFGLEPGDKIYLPSTGKIEDRYVITILGYDEDNKHTVTSPQQKNQIVHTSPAKSTPTAAVKSMNRAITPIETAIYTEGRDFEGGHKFEKYQGLLIGTKMIYAEKTPEGILVACSGVISGKGSSEWNTFLYGIISKQKITEQDIVNYFTSLEKKADSLGVSFKDDSPSELFETSGKKIERNPKNIERNIYSIEKNVNIPALIADELNKGKTSVGINLSKKEVRNVDVDEMFQYGGQFEKRPVTEPFVQKKKKSLFDKLLDEIHKY